MKFWVTFLKTNGKDTAYFGGVYQTEADNFGDAVEACQVAVAAAAGITPEDVVVKMVEQVSENPLATSPE